MVRVTKTVDGMKVEVWTCQSASERDQQQTVYPWPPPSTHQLGYKWIDDMTYAVGLMPRPAAAPLISVSPGATVPIASPPAGSPVVLPPGETIPAPATKPAHPLDVPADVLAKWKREDLRTLATENSIDLDGFLKEHKNASNVQAAAFVKDEWEKKKAK